MKFDRSCANALLIYRWPKNITCFDGVDTSQKAPNVFTFTEAPRMLREVSQPGIKRLGGRFM